MAKALSVEVSFFSNTSVWLVMFYTMVEANLVVLGV